MSLKHVHSFATTIFRQILNSLACYFTYLDDCAYVQVNQLKKPVTKKYLDVTLYGNPAKLLSFCHDRKVFGKSEQHTMSL